MTNAGGAGLWERRAMRVEKGQESLTQEIFVDNFAGGGGASTGLETGLGITIAAAINHDPAAILMQPTTPIRNTTRSASGTSTRGRSAVGALWLGHGFRLIASTSPKLKVRHWSTGRFGGLPGSFSAGPHWSGPGSYFWKMLRSSRPGDPSGRASQ